MWAPEALLCLATTAYFDGALFSKQILAVLFYFIGLTEFCKWLL